MEVEWAIQKRQLEREMKEQSKAKQEQKEREGREKRLERLLAEKQHMYELLEDGKVKDIAELEKIEA